jgi:hypothetical protein
MQLKDILQQFLDLEEWKDKIVHDDGDNTDFIDTRMEIDGQVYTLQLVTDQENQVIRAILISPMAMPERRRMEGAIVVNGLNNRMSFGNLGILDDGRLYYRWAMTMDGIAATPQQFGSMVGAASSAFDNIRGAAIGAAAFSKQSAEEILRDYYEAAEAGPG